MRLIEMYINSPKTLNIAQNFDKVQTQKIAEKKSEKRISELPEMAVLCFNQQQEKCPFCLL